MEGVLGVDLPAGEYTAVPSDWRKDAGEQLGNLTSGTEGDGEALWHLHDIEDADGETVLEVLDDRREMEGLSPSDRQFLFRTPDGEPVMAWEREGFTPWAAGTLRPADGDETLARWSQSVPYVGSWTLADADGDAVATGKRRWSFSALWYPKHTLLAPDGAEFGRFGAERSGLFYHVDVAVEEPVVPVAVAVAFAYGVSWALADL